MVPSPGSTTPPETTPPELTPRDVPVPLAARAQAPAVVPLPGAALGLAWRSLTPADAPELAALVARIEEVDGAPFRTTLVEVGEWFTGSWKDPSRDTVGGFAPGGALVAYAFAEVAPGDVTIIRANLRGGVHPAYRRRGIGTALVRWMDARGRQLLAASGSSAAGWLTTFLEGESGAEHRLFAAAGFTPARWFTTMRRDLAEPSPERAVPSGLTLVPWSIELDDAIRVAHNEAFADHWGSQPRTAEQWRGSRSSFVPRWSFAIVADADADADADESPAPVVAGYLMAESFVDDWPVLGYSFGYVHQLGVRRPWRRQGLAVALLAAAMDAFRSEGVAYAVLDVDTENPTGAHGVYSRVGFTPVHRSVAYTIEL
ncbi:GNAT family N-acetyltransferase [Pengzhenrongella frigida]|uniref:GNAT family N-acetyltransferase n=1 Tax=Pengzhenrongella frigida TaxID=1259133 RepID=A0A4Q5MXI9_9MICO|nr:GNAT family N-acetyltransferase [Cellulomonas sp. HLT2-17]RYV50336.1 GNAT family N-acetyltransferase [Cellulomonas sp. HLT2-17]